MNDVLTRSRRYLDPVLKNEYSKRLYARLGVRKPFVRQGKTAHYRMPVLEENGGFRALKPYSGPPIPPAEWEGLEYVTYPSDPDTYFAPLTSATGENILRGFWDFGKPDLDGIWTSNAENCPTIVNYVKSIENRYGRVQLIRMEPNSLREARWGLHLDDNNRLNPETNGWVVRMWLELTDDPESLLIVRENQFDVAGEVRIPLPRYAQAVVDSEYLFHGGYHQGPHTRYALITSFESTPNLDAWIRSELP
jgi:hypothetical protein